MFGLFKKIANYFTPLDEEAEVERAAAAAPMVVVNDEDPETTAAASDKSNNIDESSSSSSPEVFKPLSNDPIDRTFSYVYPDLATLDASKRKRNIKPQKPGESKFRLDVEPTALKTPNNPTTTTTTTVVRRGNKNSADSNGFWMYDMDGSPLFWPGRTITATTTSKPTTNDNGSINGPPTNLQNQLHLPGATESKQNNIKDKPTTATSKPHTGRPLDTTNPPTNGTKSQLGKRQKQIKQESKKNKKAPSSSPSSSPPPKKRVRQGEVVQPRTTRGRSKKLGDYQCLICAETFDDLESRDNHSEIKHPHSSMWIH